MARSCANKDVNRKYYVCKPNIPAGIKCPPPSKTISLMTRFGTISTYMIQQLLQAKSADGDQQKEKSCGSGRGGANDDIGGAGRAPREEGAAGTSVGATKKTAAGGKMPSHSSRASDGSRPADDTGRTPEVPAGVDPMINMQRGEARELFFLGAAHDGNGVVSSGCQKQSRVVPPVLKGEFQHFKHEFLLKANMLDTSGTSRRPAQTEGSAVTESVWRF